MARLIGRFRPKADIVKEQSVGTIKSTFCILLTVGSSLVVAADMVKVSITPHGYQTGDVRSALATPVVDEVVRLKPSLVLMNICKRTPASKVVQFEVELRPRHKSPLKGKLTEEACPV